MADLRRYSTEVDDERMDPPPRRGSLAFLSVIVVVAVVAALIVRHGSLAFRSSVVGKPIGREFVDVLEGAASAEMLPCDVAGVEGSLTGVESSGMNGVEVSLGGDVTVLLLPSSKLFLGMS